jgi:hypothetical protein
MNKRRYTKLSCHMCAVHTGFGRTIKVIGLYSICDWCFKNIIPEFEKEFEITSAD